jgi:hypothetical protein
MLAICDVSVLLFKTFRLQIGKHHFNRPTTPIVFESPGKALFAKIPYVRSIASSHGLPAIPSRSTTIRAATAPSSLAGRTESPTAPAVPAFRALSPITRRCGGKQILFSHFVSIVMKKYFF